MTSQAKPPTAEVRKREFADLILKLNAWSIPDDAMDRVHDAARASLNEVKALTEYEDGKVSRLLTIIAFLSAVVGAVFTRFAGDYAWPGVRPLSSNWEAILVAATYFAFFAYVLLVTWSVLRVLGAIKPTFKVPATWTGSSKQGLPASMVFYEKILDVTAPKWGEAFEQPTSTDGKALKKYYAKCYVAESYLVAEKVAVKLQILSPGVRALQFAMGILLFFFILFAATEILVVPTRPTSNQSSTPPASSQPSRPG